MGAFARPAWALGLTLLVAPLASLADEPAAAPEMVAGLVEVAEPVADPDYGVRVDALGLRREVQMWQWQRDGEGFSGTWSAEPIDASGFPPEHANPGNPPYGSAEWFAGQVHLDGRRLSPELIATLQGWEPVPVGRAAAALPPNLAVVFQSDGAWLSSSADPGAPHIGDLRIRWQQLPGGALHGELVADDQRWVATAPGSGLSRGEPPRHGDRGDPVPGVPDREAPGSGMAWLAWVLLAFMLVGGFVLYRRNR